MTAKSDTMGERMARLEQRTSNIEDKVDCIGIKLDKALEMKADKNEVSLVQDQVTYIRRGMLIVALAVISGLMGAIWYLMTTPMVCLA